ncbi:MAG: hypothetical protein JOZ58_18700 [Acetobacteraceae bacterium]|nr:hypothetical protein [Acetobacteraceae bacterium]MBV8577054.1 hypothetical protein [Acetobacteraceae bacterium]
MLRFAELALFLAPFAAYLVWYLTASRGGPSPGLLAISAGALVILAAALIWFAMQEKLGPGQVYVPAQLQGGRIIPGHAAAHP